MADVFSRRDTLFEICSKGLLEGSLFLKMRCSGMLHEQQHFANSKALVCYVGASMCLFMPAVPTFTLR